jgi:predicted MPP superfamily phosphohydrolase
MLCHSWLDVAVRRFEMTSSGSTSESILLVHLSDIHFSKADAAGNGVLNEDVRNEVRNDVLKMAGELGKIHGFLVTGDIAFAGKEEEYQQAERWLLELCEKTGCKEEDVWVICGNHDVQRPIIASSMMVENFQEKLRSVKVDEINETIKKYLLDHAGRTEIFSPLKNYNAFAAKFGGHFAADRVHWEEDLRLNDGSKLRIRGVNSTFCSNKEDNIEGKKLVVGSAQVVLDRADGVEHLVMCHHPPDWLRDQDAVLEYLESRARLVLFGHKHKSRVRTMETPGGFSSIWLHAGAVNPDLGDGTKPHYSLLRLHVEAVPAKRERHLRIEHFPRIWGDDTRFTVDSSNCDKSKDSRTYRLQLNWLETNPLETEAVTPVSEVVTQTQVSDPLSVAPASTQPAKAMTGSRRLAFRFLSLAYHKRMEVAHELGLLEDADSHIDDTELFKRLFRRAAERHKLDAFYKAVEAKHGKEPTSNPFS